MQLPTYEAAPLEPLWAMQYCAPAAEAGVAPAKTNAANPKPANAERFKREFNIMMIIHMKMRGLEARARSYR